MTALAIFDFDGTLAASNQIKNDAYFQVVSDLQESAAVMGEVRTEFPFASRYETMGLFAERYCKAQAADLDAGALGEKLAQAYGDYCDREILKCAEIPGAEALLQRLQDLGIPAYLNSATPDAPLARAVEGRGWTGYFADLYGATSGNKVENSRTILAQSGKQAYEISFIGDGHDDYKAACEIGCDYYILTGGTAARDGVDVEFYEDQNAVAAVMLGTANLTGKVSDD